MKKKEKMRLEIIDIQQTIIRAKKETIDLQSKLIELLEEKLARKK